ncbi:hypothetical protein K474DRAFT_818550 [Panus rudis PR-1116 ss-1]|nr:hypothetical protein K474DRAFT_818550 [Panus rudis PR-1116 ss-1]
MSALTRGRRRGAARGNRDLSLNSQFRGGGYRGRSTPGVETDPVTLPPDRDILDGILSHTVKVLDKPRVVSGEKVAIRELEYISSYNWVDAKEPTIIVPGSPRNWKNKALPFRVPLDSGTVFVDQNGYRMPDSPLLPLFRAVDVVSEGSTDVNIDWPSVDFVTDRNGLRKLLRWIDSGGGEGSREKRTFRIDTQLAGSNTVLFSRWQERTIEQAQGGSGFSFEKETTKPAKGCERSTGHHRIIKYDLDGLTMVVRFEVDACIEDVDDLADQLSGLSVSSSSQTGDAKESSEPANSPKVIRAGSQVKQENIIEMTTRSERNAANFNWTEAYPQLYLSRTPHHFLAIHNRGTFYEITKRKLNSPEMKTIEEAAEVSMKKLRVLLGAIQDEVVTHGKGGRLSLICQNDKLEVRERESQDSLIPDEAMERFRV